MQKNAKQRLLGFIMLSVTAVVWGAGFVINDQLLATDLGRTPVLINAMRFAVAAVCVVVAFARKIKITKNSIVYGAVSGALLFLGFLFQLLGLQRSTPSHCGFFSAAYVLFVPLIGWILTKKCPNVATFVSVALAIGGMLILNFTSDGGEAPTTIGDLISLAGALMFGLQIIWADRALKQNKTDEYSLTAIQVVVCALAFVAYTLIFESKNYGSISLDFGYLWWRIALMGAVGSAFAYFAQTYAQARLTPLETSLVIACESPVGAFLSVIIGLEELSWTTVVGGLLIVLAVVMSQMTFTCRKKRQESDKTEPIDASESDPPSAKENDE